MNKNSKSKKSGAKKSGTKVKDLPPRKNPKGGIGMMKMHRKNKRAE